MRSEMKYLGYGLTIGMFVAALMITGIIFATAGSGIAPLAPIHAMLISPTPTIPTNTPSPTLTPPPTATRPPTTTFTPSSTATLTASERLVLNGGLIFSGPLTQDQQKKLYDASIQFIAPTFRESKKVGEMINGKGYGSPTLICGPLSLAILQNAGLIEYEDVIPYDFWLLNPYLGKDRALINRVFPKDKYEDTLFKTPIDKFDWSAQPLQPGDFLFIKHGTGGNFDHILVVNRVDGQMRAYSVTNFGTPDGHIIDEVMLYDLNDPDAGIFHTWTEKQNAALGSTGFGGFEVWRLKSP
jgi:hypothetical protein